MKARAERTSSRRGKGGEEWLGGPLWSPAVPRKDVDPNVFYPTRPE
jgi:hypothetical protein